MSGGSSDADGTIDGPDSTDPPGAVSNQNREEAESGHEQARERPPAGAEDARGSRSGAPAPADSSEPADSSGSSPGAASEGSQATGHPENAG